MFTWISAISGALLLTGMMIGTWEFGEFTTRWTGQWGSRLAAITLPWGLFLAGYNYLLVPWSIFAIGIITISIWDQWYVALLAGTSFAGAWEVMRFTFHETHVSSIIGGLALFLFGLLAVVWRSWYSKHPIFMLLTLYASAEMTDLIFGAAFSDPNSERDFLRSGILIAFVTSYAVLRTYRRNTQHDLRLRASKDFLTGTFTRYGLEEWLLSQRDTAGTIYALDIDDFKVFNDTWGHKMGDQVLRIVAQQIRLVCPVTHAIVRPGGDEFTVWSPQIDLPSSARTLADAIHRSITEHSVITDRGPWPIRLSIGYAIGSLNTATADCADLALLHAKRLGKDRVVEYSKMLDITGYGMPNRSLVLSSQHLWENWQDAAVLTDLQGHIVSVNSAYEKLTGRTQAELSGRFPGITGSGNTPKSVYDDLWGTLSDKHSWQGLFLNQHRDGTLWWAYENVYPVVGTEGEISGYWAQVKKVFPKEPVALLGADLFQGTIITPVYQPIVELKSGLVIGYEILSRPRLGSYEYSPDDLFTIATSLNQVALADRLCLTTIASELAKQPSIPVNTKWFVNVRVETLSQTDTFLAIAKRLSDIVGSESLVWELCEQSPDIVESISAEVFNQPIGTWAIDDWGTGQHPLAFIRWITVEWIKVDRRWIIFAITHEESRALLIHLLDWARQIGYRTVAEGIETEEEARHVMEWGFDAAQGYLWGKPRSTIFEEDILGAGRRTNQASATMATSIPEA